MNQILEAVLIFSILPLILAGPTELWRVFDVRGVDPELVPSKFPPPLPPFHPEPTTEMYPPKPDPEDMVQWYKYAAEKKPKMSMEASNSKRRKSEENDGTSRSMSQKSDRMPKLDQEDDEENFNPTEWSWNSKQSFGNDSPQEVRESRQKKYKKPSSEDDFSSDKRVITENMKVRSMNDPRETKSPYEDNEQSTGNFQDNYDGGSSVPANEYVQRQMELLMSRKRQFSPQPDGSADDDDDDYTKRNWNSDESRPVKSQGKQEKSERDELNENGSRGKFDDEPEINPFEYPSTKRNRKNDSQRGGNRKPFGLPEDIDSTSYSPKKLRKQNYN